MIGLFSGSGIVDSPLYGIKNASDFYKALANDTSNSVLHIKGIFEDDDLNQIALYFTYNWTLKHNEVVVFDVVDIITLIQKTKLKN